jgi:multidrug efflux pump subunit AcrB
MGSEMANISTSSVRLRPILMRAGTTILAVLPVAYTLPDDVQNRMRVLLRGKKP